MNPVVTLDDLYTDIALRKGTAHPVGGVSLTVGKGESLGIVGESGCGKTMTALSIMRLLPRGGRVTRGSITLGDTDLATLDGLLAKRGYSAADLEGILRGNFFRFLREHLK